MAKRRDDQGQGKNAPHRKGGEPKGKPRDPVPPKAKRGRKGKQVSLAEYDAMWLAYQEDQTIAHVARSAGVTRACARAYIREGEPNRGLPALEYRLKQLNELTRSIADRSAAEDRAKLLLDADRVQAALMQKLEAGALEFKDPARALKSIADVRLAVGKEADHGEGSGSARESLDALTDEQVGNQLLALVARLGLVDDTKRSKRRPRPVQLAGPESKAGSASPSE